MSPLPLSIEVACTLTGAEVVTVPAPQVVKPTVFGSEFISCKATVHALSESLDAAILADARIALTRAAFSVTIRA